MKLVKLSPNRFELWRLFCKTSVITGFNGWRFDYYDKVSQTIEATRCFLVMDFTRDAYLRILTSIIWNIMEVPLQLFLGSILQQLDKTEISQSEAYKIAE